MAYQADQEKHVVYEKETVVRNLGGGKDAAGGKGGDGSFSASFHGSNGFRAAGADEPSMKEYLKGFSKVAKRCFKDYQELSYDVCQSLMVLFVQHPSLGILFLVTGLFVTAPVGVFLGFAVVSFVSILVSALFIEGALLGTGLVVLFFVVPASFVVGLGVASFATAFWIAVTSAYNLVRGHGASTSATKTD